LRDLGLGGVLVPVPERPDLPGELLPLPLDVLGPPPPPLPEERLEVDAVGEVDVEDQQAGHDPDEPEGGRVHGGEPEVLPLLPGGAAGGRWRRAHRSWLQLNAQSEYGLLPNSSTGTPRAWAQR